MQGPHHLYVMRHAHTEPGRSGISDKARELSAAGLGQIRNLSRCLDKQGYAIEQAFVSTATRTQQSHKALGRIAREKRDIELLYHCNTIELNTLIEKACCHSLLIVGHNPVLSDWLLAMTNLCEVKLGGAADYLPFFDMSPATFVALERQHSDYVLRQFWTVNKDAKVSLQCFR